MTRALALGVALAALAACTPPTQAQIEQRCAARADDAAGPKSEVSLGVVGDRNGIRPAAGITFSVSGDALRRLDPAQVYERCVIDRTGRAPATPYVPGR